jgi:muramoyltetrapeptide carboxypeptidase
VRFISPSSPADRASVVRFAGIVESWGLKVDFGKHAFARIGFLAGPDEDRAADLNEAPRAQHHRW